ncbi:glycoside hydrolase, putative [Phytophthora infestans T30-4]|uniref:Glycoside hydrolase, putative n=1 Tax=Phytophthora infestans (strain T30-4) TaxID=403677 RepID=D0NTR7_PHYIT|nr:glycoside hydrolase, putative [Phytophthora infestans T30-4]EEY65029.1 glycoside hydrolase, putative [Phytophthora infestans T30-4]|eukprot:XP_002897517.1 glycoside hydrolase, putative [Phytophthora infestans T30-4]
MMERNIEAVNDPTNAGFAAKTQQYNGRCRQLDPQHQVPESSLISTAEDRAISTKNYMSLLTSVLACRQIGVLLSLHTLTTTDNGGLWYSESITQTEDICSKTFWNVIGLDLKNERGLQKINEYPSNSMLANHISATMDNVFGFIVDNTSTALLLVENGWAGGFVWSLNPETSSGGRKQQTDMTTEADEAFLPEQVRVPQPFFSVVNAPKVASIAREALVERIKLRKANEGHVKERYKDIKDDVTAVMRSGNSSFDEYLLDTLGEHFRDELHMDMKNMNIDPRNKVRIELDYRFPEAKTVIKKLYSLPVECSTIPGDSGELLLGNDLLLFLGIDVKRQIDMLAVPFAADTDGDEFDDADEPTIGIDGLKDDDMQGSPEIRRFVDDFNSKLIELGWVYENQATRWACPARSVRKGAGEFRQTAGYKPVNALVEAIVGVMPDLSTDFSDIEGAVFFRLFDFMEGYWQLALTEASNSVKLVFPVEHATIFQLYCEHRNLFCIFAPGAGVKKHIGGQLPRLRLKGNRDNPKQRKFLELPEQPSQHRTLASCNESQRAETDVHSSRLKLYADSSLQITAEIRKHVAAQGKILACFEEEALDSRSSGSD